MFNNVITNEQRMLVAKLGALPLVTGIYHALNGALVVNDFHQTKAGFCVVLGFQNGLNILTLDKNDVEYVLRINNRYAGDYTTDTHVLTKTANIKYLLRSVQSGSSRKRVQENIAQASHYFEERLNAVANKYRNDRPNIDAPRLPLESTEWLLNNYFGKPQTTLTPNAIQANLESIYEKIKANNQKLEGYNAQAADMFNKDKWVVFYRPAAVSFNTSNRLLSDTSASAGDFMIGLIDGQSLYDKVTDRHDAYKKVTVNFKMPMTLYRGIDNIDPAFRDEILGKITMAKTFGCATGQITHYADEDTKLFPVNVYGNCLILNPVNYIAEGRSSTVVVMVDK